MATKIQIRRDTAADWTSTNPTLAAGEFGWESDTNKFKIGDGATAWTSLNYAPEGYATTSYVDTQDANIASDSLVFTNKTFDANGTGNSISNIETADIAAGTLVTAAEGIGSNDNDTTIPTSAAVKAYADSVGGGGGGTITALNNQAENRLVSIGSTTTELDGEANLTFDGSTLTLTGSAALDGVTITDNLITTNRSNDDLNLTTSGTGYVQLKANGGDFDNYSTNARYSNSNNMYYESLSDTLNGSARNYKNNLIQNIKLTTGQTSSSSNDVWRNSSVTNIDLNGSSATATQATYRSRGPMGLDARSTIDNSSATNSTLGNASGGNYGIAIIPTGTGDITITNTTGMGSYLDVPHNANMDITITDHVAYESVGIDHYGSGTGNFNITDHWHFRAGAHNDGATATLNLTNNYGFYFENDSTATNTYAFYDASNSMSVFGDIQTQAVSITDNLITTNRSNDNLNMEANGTGQIQIRSNGGDFTTHSTNSRFASSNIMYYEDQSETVPRSNRLYTNNMITDIKLTAGQSASTGSNDRWRQHNELKIDLNGNSTTNTAASRSRGATGLDNWAHITNSNSGNAAMGQAMGLNNTIWLTTTNTGDLTLTDTTSVSAITEFDSAAGTTINISDARGFFSFGMDEYGSGTVNVTDYYHFYVGQHSGVTPTNNYAFYDGANALSRFGAVILANQASDPSGVTDSSHIYAKDDAGSSEVYVRDEAGNVTKISPHNEAGEWEYYSVNKNTGKTVRVNMERMIRKLEELTGESFIDNE